MNDNKDFPVTNNDSTVTNNAPHICINCGTEFYDTFCPHCGQKVSEKQITIRTLFVNGFKDLCKFNSGFLYTFYRLALYPWTVIRDYLNGHRVQYTSPINMLVIALFYFAIFGAIFHHNDAFVSVDLSEIFAQQASTSFIDKCIKVLSTSTTFWLLILSLPMAYATYLIYNKRTERKRAFAEYLVAAIYAISAKIVWEIILMPVVAIHDYTGNILNHVVTIYLVVSLLYNAFHIPNIWKRIGLMMLCFLNIFLFAAITIIAVGIFLGLLIVYC